MKPLKSATSSDVDGDTNAYTCLTSATLCQTAKPVSHLGERSSPHPVFTNLSANSAGDIFINGKLFNGQRDYINFQHDGKQKQRKKWVIVYECLFDIIPPGKIVKHHDNNQSNNSASNLYLKDKKFTMERTVSHKIIAKKLNDDGTDEVEAVEYDSMYACSKDLGVNTGGICQVLAGKSKKVKSKINGSFYTFKVKSD